MEAKEAAGKAKAAVAKGADETEAVIEKTASGATAATRRAEAAAIHAIDSGRDIAERGQDAVESALASASQTIRERPLTAMAVIGLLAYICGRLR